MGFALGNELGTIVRALKDRGITDPFHVDQIQRYAPTRQDLERAYVDILLNHLYGDGTEPGTGEVWKTMMLAYSGMTVQDEGDLVEWGILQRSKDGNLYMPKVVDKYLGVFLDENDINN